MLVKFSKMFLCADDTKCHRKIYNTSDSLKLQEELDMLYQWSLSNQWSSQMFFIRLLPQVSN